MKTHMYFKSTTYFACFILCCTNITHASDDENTTIITRLSTGYLEYNLTLPGVPPIPFQHLDDSSYLLGIGATIFNERFYFDIYGQTSGDLSDVVNAPSVGYLETFEGKRTNISFSTGYSITNQSALYVGYKDGKSDNNGNLGGVYEFKENGFFIGGTYGWQVSAKGVISLNAAFAELEGDAKFNTPAVPSYATSIVGKATGLSYGIAWRSKLNNQYGYSLSLDHQSYEFKDMIDRALGSVPGTVIEDMLTLKLSISYEI